MSIQATSLSGSSGLNYSGIQNRANPPDFTKDQLVQLEQKLKSKGKDTSNLDKIIQNFSQLDTNQNGKLSLDELKSGAQQYGIKLPRGHHNHHHGGGDFQGSQSAQNTQPFVGGPPPGLLSNDPNGDGDTDGQSSTTTTGQTNTNSYMNQLLQSFIQTNPDSLDTSNSSTVNIAA